MAVAREFDIDEARVLVVVEHAEDGDEIQLAFAEHQMLVFAIADVFDVDVADEVGKLAIDLAERRGFGAEHMADVQGQSKPRAANMFLEHFKLRHVVHQHSRFRLKGELHPAALGVLRELQATRHKPVPSLMFGNFGFRCARPEADAFGVQIGGDIDRASEEFQTDLTTLTADECGMVFALRIEKVTRPGFDHDAELQLVEELAQATEIGGLDREGVAVVIVQRQRDAAIAAIGDDLQRIFKLVVRKPVCVVTETQIHLPASHDDSPWSIRLEK